MAHYLGHREESGEPNIFKTGRNFALLTVVYQSHYYWAGHGPPLRWWYSRLAEVPALSPRPPQRSGERSPPTWSWGLSHHTFRTDCLQYDSMSSVIFMLWSSPLLMKRKIIQGYSLTLASCPPTILLSSFRTPHFLQTKDKWIRKWISNQT